MGEDVQELIVDVFLITDTSLRDVLVKTAGVTKTEEPVLSEEKLSEPA
jgi:hypothetical protein